jgi:prevent-host-death family protein
MENSMATWQVQTAKNRLSEVIARAESEGPQMITHRGKDKAVVLSVKQYRRLLKARPTFKQFLMMAPLDGIDLARERDTGREIDL